MDFNTYLIQNKISRRQAARDLKVHRCHLDGVIGQSRPPSYDLAIRVVEYTKGAVTLEELMVARKKYNCPCCGRQVSKERFLNIEKNNLDQKSPEQAG